ncbi:hypothetical protein J5N97_027908 [Dioscorea zingiberensis]|uniref:RING-type domain-containing protein n=1 Tax=Dioscorea zingiberensis TaxID=325984 RepID=A0A9D5BY95_9LILI|nr:hypothetical protein J5N97_027908 [Dioscorea zingiberensis]
MQNRCIICAQSVKRGQGTAVFTAECSHSFHFPCILTHIHNHGCLVCLVCSAVWRQASFLSSIHQNSSGPDPKHGNGDHCRRNKEAAKPNKLYDDDEPLLLSSSGGRVGGVGSRFVLILEEADDDDKDVEFQGFSVAQSPPTGSLYPPTFVASIGGGVLGVDVSVVPMVRWWPEVGATKTTWLRLKQNLIDAIGNENGGCSWYKLIFKDPTSKRLYFYISYLTTTFKLSGFSIPLPLLLVRKTLVFFMWTNQMHETLNSTKHGDRAFRAKDFVTAIDYYTQVAITSKA